MKISLQKKKKYLRDCNNIMWEIKRNPEKKKSLNL